MYTASVVSHFGSAYSGDNTRNRIVGVLYFDNLNTSNPDDNSYYANGTFYDYDVHGNVKHLIQLNKEYGLRTKGQNIKHVEYEYDLLSGNVNKVVYQRGMPDQFIHRYSYDADNRITIAETSKDDIVYEKEAKYFYYDHGPLARTELGDKTVQALDYAYTIQGWLKAVNGEERNAQTMLGKDGLSGTINQHAGQDAMGFSLHYFSGDYNAAETAMLNYSAGTNPNQGASLYNGNIRTMVTTLSDNTETALAAHQTNYTYDQLNRIKSMIGYNRIAGTTTANLSGYKSEYAFDPNGNLETLKRWAHTGTGSVLMDNFSYKYEEPINAGKNNQLSWVDDLAGASNAAFDGADIDNSMNAGNYDYDAIGQLIKDTDEGITNIEWTVTNKVKRIDYSNGKELHFDYDAMGNRIAKHVIEQGYGTTTYYTLDAQGNVMCVYEYTDGDNKLYLSERNIYGSSRLGQEQLNMELTAALVAPWPVGIHGNEVGDKRYELANHLGNVLNVVTDRKIATTASFNQVVSPNYTNTTGVNISGGEILRNVAGTGWGASGGGSVQELGQGDSFEWILGGASATDNRYIMCGLSYTNPDHLYTSIKYAWYTHTSGLTIMESGTNVSGVYGSYGAYAPGGILKIERLNGQINYYYNGVLKRTVTDAQPTVPMVIDFSLYELGRRIYGLSIEDEGEALLMADVVNYSDYYPYGMLLAGKKLIAGMNGSSPAHYVVAHGTQGEYRYGFNGMEADDEVKSGTKNSYDFGARMYDPRVGRFLSIDPKIKEFPWQTSYSFAANNPVCYIDANGEAPLNFTWFLKLGTIGPRILAKVTGNTVKLKFSISGQIQGNIMAKGFGFSKDAGFAVDKRGNFAYYNSGASQGFDDEPGEREGVLGGSVDFTVSAAMSAKTNVMDMAGRNVAGLSPSVELKSLNAKLGVGFTAGASSDEVSFGIGLGLGFSMTSYSSNTFVFATTFKDLSNYENALWSAGKTILKTTGGGQFKLNDVRQTITTNNKGYKQIDIEVEFVNRRGKTKTRTFKALEFKEDKERNLIYTKNVDTRR